MQEKKRKIAPKNDFSVYKRALPGVAEEILGIGEAKPALATAGFVAFVLAPTMQEKAQMLGGYFPAGQEIQLLVNFRDGQFLFVFHKPKVILRLIMSAAL